MNPYGKRLGILIPTHYDHFPVIERTIDCCRRLNPKCIIVASDIHFKPFNPALVLDIKKKVDYFTETMPPPVEGMWIKGGHWLSAEREGIKLIKGRGIEYILSINGDCIFHNPNAFWEVFERFIKEKADLMCCYHFLKKDCLGTMSFLAKLS